MNKTSINELMESDNIPNYIKNVLLLRQEAGKSSTKKLNAIMTAVDEDNRVRENFQYHAAATGRWGGKRIQLQNLKRPLIDQWEVEDIIERVKKNPKSLNSYISLMHKESLTGALSNCLRAMFVAAPKHNLLSIDFSSIEARVLAWLAGEESTLNIFRTHGLLYEHTAQQIYNVSNIKDVNKPQRLVGKISSLALGFQGGANAFMQTAKAYSFKMTKTQANQIKELWRSKNPSIVKYWYSVEKAALLAVQHKGRVFATGHKDRQVKFKVMGSFLLCKLPSGRCIYYAYPEIKEKMTPWGAYKNCLFYKGMHQGKWSIKDTYGGKLVENITQAVARDLLAEALLRFDNYGLKIILHVHDEIVSELKEKTDFNLDAAKVLMDVVPPWAKELPIASSGWIGKYYRK